MRLVDLLPLLIVRGQKKCKFFGGKPPDIHLKHARATWKGQAYLQRVHIPAYQWAEYRIWANGCNASYSLSFDDLMADDWELVSDQRGEDTQ